jgi:hypothetical protein
MAGRTEETARPRASAPPRTAPELPPLGPTLALTVAFAAAGFAVLAAVVLIVDPPTRLPPPFPAQNQDAETLIYVLTYAAILPLSLFGARRVGRAIAADALAAVAALLLAALAVAVLALKLAGTLGLGDGVRALLIAAAAWWLAAGATLARASRARAWPALLRLAPLAEPLWALTAVLVFGALFSFAFLASISLPVLLVGLAIAVAAALALDRVTMPRAPRAALVAIDLALLAIVVLAVPDLVVFRPEQAAGNADIALETGIIQFHQDFLLGPANEVLGGHAMLVDVASQYGVSDIYALALWFLVAPIGYGTLSLLTGAMTAAWFAGGYGLLRLARVPRLLAGCALAVGVVVLCFNLLYPVGALPQSGPLRFGMPMLLLLAVVAGEGRPARVRLTGAVELAVVGLSAVWSLEAFAYTAGVFAAVAATRAWLSPQRRLRRFARQTAAAVAACVLAHLAFAGATLVAAGHLPAWGDYIAYLRQFLGGRIGNLTYDVPRWAPALAVGALYLASAAALVELLRRRAPLVARERPAVLALTGLTAYGILIFSYYVDRSLDHILLHVSLPALLTAALWLSLVLRSREAVSPALRRGGLAFAVGVAALLVATAWSSTGDRFPRTALAHAAPGGSSLRGAIHRLWQPPPLDAAAPAGQEMLARYMPGERSSLVIVAPDLGAEILLRSGRFDPLLLGDAWEESLAPAAELPHLRKTVAAVRPGTRMLLDAPARRVLAALRSRPGLDPLTPTGLPLAPLQRWALARLAARFRLVPVARDSAGFSVVTLRAR